MPEIASSVDLETKPRHLRNKIFITTIHEDTSDRVNSLLKSQISTLKKKMEISDQLLNSLDIKETERDKAVRHSKTQSLLSKNPTILSSSPGVVPSIQTSKISGDTVLKRQPSKASSRNGSIQRQRRNKLSAKDQIKNRLFPFNAKEIREHHKRKVRRGKFRNIIQMDSYLDYANIDAEMSRELIMNQPMTAFSISNIELLKIEPKLKALLKMITVDSKSNYILYTPIPTGDSSIVSLFEDQLLGLFNVYPNISATSIQPSTPKKTPLRFIPSSNEGSPATTQPSLNRSNKAMDLLQRTNSLPLSFKSQRRDNLEKLWRSYYRTILANRIKFRLTNTIPSLYTMSTIEDNDSVETEFFISAEINPHHYSPNKNSPLKVYSDRAKNKKLNIKNRPERLVVV